MSTSVLEEEAVDPKPSGDGGVAAIKTQEEAELSPRRQTFSQIMEEKRTSL